MTAELEKNTKPVVDETKKEEETTTNEETKVDENELILIQDNAFVVKIHVSGMEPFDLQVTSMELVQEINQMLMDKEETCHRTCFSLQLDGQVLDSFSELKTIESLKDGSVIKLVDEPYTVRQVRLHVRHVNDLIHSIDLIDNYNAVNCNSLTYVNELTLVQDDNNNTALKPFEYILPGTTANLPLLPLHQTAQTSQVANAGTNSSPSGQKSSGKDQAKSVTTTNCLKQLTFSGWNAPNGKRKMKGDLLYLHVITNEDKRFHITACTRGFFVNQSTDDVFNPKQDNSYKICHSLVDLLNVLSASFKRNFSQIQKKRTQKHPFERIGTPYQVYSWLSPDFDHTVDWFRAEDSNASKLGHEDHIPGHSRDWNEEIQATRELPKKTLPERLIRERAMFKVHCDFVNAATRGAQLVVENNIMAINPGEDSKIQMFIWNNMFFSLGFDVKDHYKDFGGDYAAYVAPMNDLKGVKALNLLDLDGLYTLGTVVIDYKGFRVTAQSIIPGILDKDQEQSVVHGSTDFGKTCVTHPKYNELLEKVAAHLKMRPHKIKVENNEDSLLLYTSIECKGIIGNDGRYYLLDLLRMFPADLNYLNVKEGEDQEQKFRHKLCCLRQELVESFIDSKYIQFVKHAALQIQQLNLDAAAAAKDSTTASPDLDKAKQIVKELTATEQSEADSSKQQNDANNNVEQNAQIIEDACKHVGSWKSSEFDIRFNPNMYQPHVRMEENADSLDKDTSLLKEASEYLTNVQLPQFIKELVEHTLFVCDGSTLSDLMHSRGINMRYLGTLVKQLRTNPSDTNTSTDYVYAIGVNELVSRCSKRVFRQYIQNVSNLNLSTAIAHYLNCYLSNFVKTSNANSASSNGSAAAPSQALSATTAAPSGGGASSEAAKKKKKNQKKGVNKQNSLDQNSNEWQSLTPRSLWAQIREEAQAQYDYELKVDNNEDQTFQKLKLRKLTLLRSFCQTNGIQLLLREYNFDLKHKETFNEDDILNLYPIVKHVGLKLATDAYNFFTNGQAKIQQGFLKDGFELIQESYNLLSNVYGALHPDICMCLRLLARLNYILGDFNEAYSTQHKTVMMCERLFGLDSPQLITEYLHLALYSFASLQQINTSLKYLYRARYLLQLSNGGSDDHPETSLIDSNLGLILQANGDLDYALKYLENSLELNKKYFGAKSMKTALAYHLVARLQSCRGDFRTALMNERETYQIYKQLLGEQHERTKESAQVLKHLTEQAVILQKKMNEMLGTTGGHNHSANALSGSLMPPIQIQQPSLQTVLAMLNIINGIIFIPSTHEQELDRIREELVKYQQQQQQQQQKGEIKTAETQRSVEQQEKAAAKVNQQDDDLQ